MNHMIIYIYGGSARRRKLRRTFQEKRAKAPSILVVSQWKWSTARWVGSYGNYETGLEINRIILFPTVELDRTKGESSIQLRVKGKQNKFQTVRYS